jgi:hypothetical protein
LIYNQIYTSYLTVEKVGNDVENTQLEAGTNYTPMEHHWDEAFGYFSVPFDFPKGEPVLSGSFNRFWAAYTMEMNPHIDVAQALVTAYITGRAAIVAKDYKTKNTQIVIILDLHELVAATAAVHYINAALALLDSNDKGSLFHALSEGYGFVNAIKYSPNKKLTSDEISIILNSNFGTDGDFWTVTKASLEAAKASFADAYPVLKSKIDTL